MYGVFFFFMSISNGMCFLNFICVETLLDTRWATSELAWVVHPESGVSMVISFYVSKPCFLPKLMFSHNYQTQPIVKLVISRTFSF